MLLLVQMKSKGTHVPNERERILNSDVQNQSPQIDKLIR